MPGKSLIPGQGFHRERRSTKNTELFSASEKGGSTPKANCASIIMSVVLRPRKGKIVNSMDVTARGRTEYSVFINRSLLSWMGGQKEGLVPRGGRLRGGP